MSCRFDTTDIRYIRLPLQEDESSLAPPYTQPRRLSTDLSDGRKTPIDLEGGGGRSLAQSAHSLILLDDSTAVLEPLFPQSHGWARRKRIPFVGRWLGCGHRTGSTGTDQYIRRRKTPRPLRFILKSLAISLMLL